MSNDNSAEVRITGDASGVVAAASQAHEAVKAGIGGIKEQFDKVGDAFGAVQSKLVMLAAVVAGGAFFKEAIAETNELVAEQITLSKRLGITGVEASALNTALGDIGSDSETYIGAFDKFAKQLKTNEDGLRAMGLQTRDANGNLRDSNTLFTEALHVVGDYKPGLDQTTAAMTLFGRGVDDAMKLQRLNNEVIDEARAKNAALGLTLSVEGVAASKAYKLAMNDVGDVLLAVKNAVGQAVMPVFTDMANYFASTGPYVVNVFKGALTGLLLVFRTVQAAVKIVTGAVFEFVSATVDNLGNLADVFRKLFAGDFQGAVDSAKAIWARNGQALGRIFVTNVKDAFADAQDSFAADLQRIWNPTPVAEGPKGGTKTMGDMKAAGPEKSNMALYEEQLAQQKLLAAQADALHDYSKQQEIAYWQSILGTNEVSGKDQIAIQRKIAELQIQVLRESARQRQQLDQITRDTAEKAALGELDMAKEKAQGLYDLGEISKGELIEQERQLELQRFEIKRAYLEAREALIDPDRDPVAYAQVNEQLEELARQHAMAMAKIQTDAAVEARAPTMAVANTLEQGFASVFARIGTSIKSIGGLMRAMGQVVLQTFTQLLAQMAAKWLVNKLLMMAISKSTAIGEITAQAGLAGAGGTASWAAAPWPINAGAPAFGAAMSAAAMAFAPMASAAQGFDIPAGVNPITQLHQREMVLPASIADQLRERLSGEGGDSGGPALAVHPMPGNFFMVNQDDLVRTLNRLHRDRFLPFEGRRS